VHKTSAGALNQLKIFSVTNLARTIKALKEKNIWVIGLDGSTETSLLKLVLRRSFSVWQCSPLIHLDWAKWVVIFLQQYLGALGSW
jgi:tRNA G18 (ribose-2'-O)-methylase SpoU